MTSLQTLIQQSLNPFDASTFKPGNFWQENQEPDQDVAEIHGPDLQSIKETLNQVSQDRRTRTLLLLGDSGSGKSYLLGRLKRQLNDRAFFAYIGPWPDSNYLWRHTLRNTIDSLIYAPAGQSESQLVLWLKGLPSLRDQSLSKRILGERSTFIRDLRASFPAGIYNAKEFFGVLYDLVTQPDLRPLAYDWLKGDDLDEEDLKALRVKRSIDSEDTARNILGNFGRLAAATQPIVLCFDELNNIPSLGDNKLDFQSLFNLNSTIHNENLRNFLIIISVINNTWQANSSTIKKSDLARIHEKIQLRPISLDQAEAIWAARLAPFHAQATPKPESPIAPLSSDYLKQRFSGGKTLPRNTLVLGQKLITYYKRNGKLPPLTEPPPTGGSGTTGVPSANFQLVWDRELKVVKQQVNRISQFTSPDLIWRLRQALEALQVNQVAPDFLGGSRFSAYSLSHGQPSKTGIVWAEDRNMTTFYYVMNACQKQMGKHTCDRLYFIRSEKLSNSRTKGQKIYQELFQSQNKHHHIKPDLLSVQYLETFHRLANAALGGELVIGQTTPKLKDLQAFVRESKVLEKCSVLRELGVIEGDPMIIEEHSSKSEIEQYVLNVVATYFFTGRITLLKDTQQQFPTVETDIIDTVIMTLCQQNRIQLVNPDSDPSLQVVCHIPT